MNLRSKREELRKTSVILKNASIIVEGNNIKKNYEKSIKIKEKQDEVYKKWNFYDNFIKATEECKK